MIAISGQKMIEMHNEVLCIFAKNNLPIEDAIELLSSILFDVMNRGSFDDEAGKKVIENLVQGYSLFLETMQHDGEF